MDLEKQLAQEWTTLQNNHESHERSALLIKLVAVAVVFGAWLGDIHSLVVCTLMLIMWLQEAVLKTWQSRLAVRLIALEGMFQRAVGQNDRPFQLHSHWLAQRAGLIRLLIEYGRSAIRPTVAFPYVALLLLAVLK